MKFNNYAKLVKIELIFKMNNLKREFSFYSLRKEN